MTCFLATACSAGGPSGDAKNGDSPSPASVSASGKDGGLISVYGTTRMSYSRELQSSEGRKVSQGDLGRDYSASDTADALPVADTFLTDFYFRKGRFDRSNDYLLTMQDLKFFKEAATPSANSLLLDVAQRLDEPSRKNERALRAWVKAGKKEADYVDQFFPKTAKDDANELGAFVALSGPDPYTYRERTVEIYAASPKDQKWRGNLVVHYRLRGAPKPHVHEVWVGLLRVDGVFKIDNLGWDSHDVK